MNRKLNVISERWPLSTPFKISGHEWTELHVIVVEISERGSIGRGEASGIYYIGETTQSMISQVGAVQSAVEDGASRDDLLTILPPGGARNAIDCALWALEADMTNKSIAELAGIECRPLETVVTIGLLPEPADMAARAKELARCPVLKVKLNADRPVERIAAIRVARPDATIIVDANQGFSIEQLKDALPAFADLRISMLEQPLPRGQDSALADLDPPFPLCADESLFDRSELPAALERYQMFNIKLDKTGGLTEALALLSEIQRHERPVMVGNMIGTSLAMTPAFLIGQFCQFVDLDGPLLMKTDRVGGLSYDGYTVHMAD